MENKRMKRTLHQLWMWMFAIGFLFIVGCNDDDDDVFDDDNDDGIDTVDNDTDSTTRAETTYNLDAVGTSSATGFVTFTELEDGEALVKFELNGLEDGTYRAYIYENNAADPGEVAVTLEDIDGSSGMSETVVGMADDGSELTYDDLVVYDGFINVLDSDSTVLLQADIGQNSLTGESTSYPLDSVSESGMNGNITFYERENEEILTEISLENADSEMSYPAHIFTNTTLDEGDSAISLNNVENGMSRTSMALTDAGEPLTYSDLQDYDGNVRVGMVGDNETTTTVSEADLGQNALTGNTTSYELTELNGSGVSGTAIYSERINGETRVDVNLDGDNVKGSHPISIYSGTMDDPGEEYATLNDIDENGWSGTNVMEDNEGNGLTYSNMNEFEGHIRAFENSSMNNPVAGGNVGANASE